MRSAGFVLAGVLIVLSHVLMSAGQGLWWGGGNGDTARTWSSASSQSGQPGANGNSQPSYSYGGVDANGVPYGGYGGNGGYHVNLTDEHGRQHSYSGGPGGYGAAAEHPGRPGQLSYSGPITYANTNTIRNGYGNSSSSTYAAACSTFYLICLFSLFLIIKS